MSTSVVSRDPHDDAAKAAASEATTRREKDQKFRKDERDGFYTLAKADFAANRPTLLDIFRDALVDASHFAPLYEIANMVNVMRDLPVDDFPAAYAFGGYQSGEFQLPEKETEVTMRDKILRHTFACAPASIILRGLAGKSTVIPWQKAAGASAFASARLSEDVWDTAKLKTLAVEIETREERALKSLFHKTGPWLIWFYPEAGEWAQNWIVCRAFVRSLDSLPDSIRHGFSPYLFTVLAIDPSKAVTPPSPAPPPPSTVTPTSDSSPTPLPAPITPDDDLL